MLATPAHAGFGLLQLLGNPLFPREEPVLAPWAEGQVTKAQVRKPSQRAETSRQLVSREALGTPRPEQLWAHLTPCSNSLPPGCVLTLQPCCSANTAGRQRNRARLSHTTSERSRDMELVLLKDFSSVLSPRGTQPGQGL